MADLPAEKAQPGTTTPVTTANAPVEQPPGDGSKFKTLLSILRK